MDSSSTAVAPQEGAASLPPRLEKFGRYFLLERIATGGMAEVYRAVTNGVEGFRRTFVVKRILAEKAASQTFVKMFIEEARICALLHHPNVVQVYDFGNVNGSYFLAMEYLQGKDLSSLLRVLRAAKAAVPPGLAAFIAREAANGLHYAHSLRGANGQPLGIVHRDVTPSNVMLLFPGGVKVLDFGIAKATEAAKSEGEGVKGKLGYLAPEQARDSSDVDGRADVFALGVTLWEMLVGRRLFAGKDDVETLQNVLQKPVPAPSSIRPEIPAELDRIVLRALERQLDRRYATADEMARECDLIVREARVDGQTLRGFLNDLFAEESSSLSSMGSPEIPDELFEAALSGAAGAPSSTGVPKADQSLTIELIEASSPNPRVRTPAPPFGVIASDGVPGRGRSGKVALLAVGVAAAVAAIVGLTRPSRHAASTRTVAEAPAQTLPASVTPVAQPTAPVAAPSPAAEAPAADPTTAAAAAAADEKAADKARRHHRKAQKLSSDMTLNPF
jgi:serine/threonine protein kinase